MPWLPSFSIIFFSVMLKGAQQLLPTVACGAISRLVVLPEAEEGEISPRRVVLRLVTTSGTWVAVLPLAEGGVLSHCWGRPSFLQRWVAMLSGLLQRAHRTASSCGMSCSKSRLVMLPPVEEGAIRWERVLLRLMTIDAAIGGWWCCRWLRGMLHGGDTCLMTPG
jgi:hypothetical protein